MKGVVNPHAIPIRMKPRMYRKMEVGDVSGGEVVIVVVSGGVMRVVRVIRVGERRVRLN